MPRDLNQASASSSSSSTTARPLPSSPASPPALSPASSKPKSIKPSSFNVYDGPSEASLSRPRVCPVHRERIRQMRSFASARHGTVTGAAVPRNRGIHAELCVRLPVLRGCVVNRWLLLAVVRRHPLHAQWYAKRRDWRGLVRKMLLLEHGLAVRRRRHRRSFALRVAVVPVAPRAARAPPVVPAGPRTRHPASPWRGRPRPAFRAATIFCVLGRSTRAAQCRRRLRCLLRRAMHTAHSQLAIALTSLRHSIRGSASACKTRGHSHARSIRALPFDGGALPV